MMPTPAVRVNPHILRHTAAMHLLEAGVQVNVIRGWLGHADLNTTHRPVRLHEFFPIRDAPQSCRGWPTAWGRPVLSISVHRSRGAVVHSLLLGFGEAVPGWTGWSALGPGRRQDQRSDGESSNCWEDTPLGQRSQRRPLILNVKRHGDR
jgi:hypothetical protein